VRAYFSSPYASHATSKDDAVWAAIRSLSAMRGFLWPVLSVREVHGRKNCVWSPLIQGQFILWDYGGRWAESDALDWCLWHLQYQPFDTLILSDTIPRKPGYGRNGMDAEEKLARKLGYRIMLETEVPGIR